MSPRSSPIDYDQLGEETRVHADCYRDPRVFEDELERIYHRTWVYVGHESEIPEPGDFKQAWIGRQSVLLIRGEDGRARVLMNRCSHRAATLCQTARGNARVLRCAYHGWSFGCDGRLRGMPYADGYGPNLDKAAWSLAAPSRVDGYHPNFAQRRSSAEACRIGSNWQCTPPPSSFAR